jgi:hypothetical protein
MPYERKGKCIYNKKTGEKKGCSSSVGKAKSHMRALYAAEKGSIKEETSKITQAILDRAEDIYQAMKASSGRKAVKKYGADAEDVLRGRAMNIAKKQVKMKNTDRLKEIIKKKLSVNEKKAKPDFLDLDKDGDKEEPMKKAAQDAKKSVKEELDYEGEMAKSELLRIMQNAQMLMSSLDDDTQLEAWVQSKITKAADYLNSVTQYLTYQNTKQGPVDEEAYYLDK